MIDPNKTLLIVEDSLLLSSALQDKLGDKGYSVVTAESGATAAKALKEGEFRLCLLDMMLPDANGKDLLAKWRKEYPEMMIVFMTAHGDVATGDYLRAGASDFLIKPFEDELLYLTLENALTRGVLVQQVAVLTQLTKRETATAPGMDDIVTSGNAAFSQTIELAKLVAQSDFSCLFIKGESGTGKGLFARSIHKAGRRAEKPFVEVNCSAMPATLIESELFGHVKGAFTDAKENKLGLFEMANGGTLFLDEIGDMDVGLQTKLLKVIEEQRFRRVGGSADICVDVAIIAATNQHVERQVQEQKFRADLYYRLNVIPLELPPLRERSSDVPILAEHFLKIYARKFGKPIKGFSKEAMDALKSYPWPGNVRELRNVVERGCILGRGELIDNPALLFPGGMTIGPSALAVSSAPVPALVPVAAPAAASPFLKAMPLAQAEEMVIRAAMREANNNKNEAAKILGVHRTTLYKKLEEYGVE